MKNSLVLLSAIVLYAATVAGALGQAGSLDITFNPGTGPNDIVTSIAVQTNGQILVGGLFTSIDGQSRSHVARLNPDGSLDPNFTPLEGPSGAVWAVAPDTAGRVLIGGSFTSVNSVQRNYFARLRADGSLDITLTNIVFNDAVTSVKRLADGTYFVFGRFTSVNGVTRFNVARLLADGALDGTFNPASRVSLVPGPVQDVAILPDGKVMLAGGFTTVDNTNRSYIARVNQDGTLDPSFDAGSIGGASVMTSVAKVLLQSDGKIIVAGDFFSVNGYSRRSIARLETNGAVDTTFVLPGGLTYDIRAAALQPDGKSVFAGGFSYSFGGVGRGYFARVSTNGSLDGACYASLRGAHLRAVGHCMRSRFNRMARLLLVEHLDPSTTRISINLPA